MQRVSDQKQFCALKIGYEHCGLKPFLVKRIEANETDYDRAARRANRIRDRKLFGLDAPAKTAPADPSGQEPGNNVMIYIPNNGRDLRAYEVNDS